MRLGIDIGGTKTDAVVIDDRGEPTRRTRLVTGLGAASVVETAVAAVTHMEELTGLAAVEFSSIGIGIPGVVDSRSGRVRHAVNLGFDDLELGEELAVRLGVEVCVENDVNAAALGAYRVMGLTGSVAYLNLGTGLAAGFVIDGELWRGARGVAGEIGHIPVDPQGVLCACGQRGCLETIASGSALSRQWASGERHPARALFAAAAQGDERACRVTARLADGIASAVRILVLTMGVETVIIAGGLSHLGGRLLRAVRGALSEWEQSSAFLASLELPSRIQLLSEESPVSAIGAAMVGTTTRRSVLAISETERSRQ